MSMAPGYDLMHRHNIPDPGAGDRYAGMRSLWLKVIIRAMFDWASYRDSTKLMQRKLAENARVWLFEPSETFNSFENICRMLDIDIRKIRLRAETMNKDDVAKIEFKERRGFNDSDLPPDDRKRIRDRGEDDEEF